MYAYSMTTNVCVNIQNMLLMVVIYSNLLSRIIFYHADVSYSYLRTR